MAGLTSGESAEDAAVTRNRGQLLLVGAFGIAVLLLVLSGVLNTVTYTESLATQDDDLHGGRDVTAFQADFRRGAAGIVARVNDGSGNLSTKTASIERSVTNWSGVVDRQYAVDVVDVNATVTNTTGGYRITQTHAREFTNASDRNNWTLATGVSNTRLFRMNISRSSLYNGSCGTGSCFRLVLDNGSATWNVSVNQSAVLVERPDASGGRCEIRADPVLIDVTGGTVGGRDCRPLSYASGLSAPYTVRYRNGNSANGTYRLTIDDTPEASNFAPSGPPSVERVVYAVSARVTYRTPRVQYRSDIRIARGEADG